mmetsp:Transcript_34524/g.62601  ORF Transcript_34524/g.62601 Transcript_34524/m.62601 type:complete len:238 (+) Transcript_34524:78-791(+)|eukprot:CAMPEP_0197640212 /NCGR_PEP_ID=MMETSP1338-20131121/14577_1 /TAXON_ID=43686 ORGANISM="Pelagodinium beii, Strain RCC1491" /NCGR_SAMPLE_ID=MMETSP1338 /ASSEMBLY_ACC=CAM_ASM_000754 /LENGTH=237 /DNA_ID=CAMNT_0043213035 /DNA_START=78 /DNA_END=791 /DNA_ORIENTATION=-
MSLREENLFLAKIAEKAEQYDHMVEYMRRIAEMGTVLSAEERNMLSAAFKSSVGTCRQAWRTLASSMIPQEDPLVGRYIQKIEGELKTRCRDCLDMLEKNGLTARGDEESQVFFLKMKGDYWRYLAEVSLGDEKSRYIEEAQETYQQGFVIAQHLASTNQVRLGLALNFSVFYYEVLSRPDEAVAFGKVALQAADEGLMLLSDDEQREAGFILGLLRDNIAMWTDGEPADGCEVQDL